MKVIDNRANEKRLAEIGDVIATDNDIYYLVISTLEPKQGSICMCAAKLLNLNTLQVIIVGEFNERLKIGYKFIDSKEVTIREIIDKDNIEILIE